MRDSAHIYGESFKQRIVEDLISWSNVSGKLDTELAEFADLIVQRLSKYKSFIGVVPCGSRVKGYARSDELAKLEKHSDLDIMIQVDKGSPDYALESGQISKDLKEIREAQPQDPDIYGDELAKDSIEKEFKVICQGVAAFNYELSAESILHLFYPTAYGPRTEEFRDKARNVLHDFSREDQLHIVDAVTDFVCKYYDLYPGKIRDRVSGMKDISDEDLGKLLHKRKNRWRQYYLEALQVKE